MIFLLQISSIFMRKSPNKKINQHKKNKKQQAQWAKYQTWNRKK